MLLWRRAFETHMRKTLGENLRLVWTRNRRVMISFRRDEGAPVLRLHESFAEGGGPLWDDVAVYLSRPGRKVPRSIREYARLISGNGGGAPRPEKTDGRGANHDLRKIYRKLNKEYFEGKLKGKITWGRKVFTDNKKSIVFGSYNPESNIIRIHPVLDTELAPLFYVESVVHHEMAHEYLATVENAGKEGTAHTGRFREIESGFRFHQLALAWERRHIRKLLGHKPARR